MIFDHFKFISRLFSRREDCTDASGIQPTHVERISVPFYCSVQKIGFKNKILFPLKNYVNEKAFIFNIFLSLPSRNDTMPAVLFFNLIRYLLFLVFSGLGQFIL